MNEEAGKLLLEDYEDFERMAKLMTTVHALKRSSFTLSKSSDAAGSEGTIDQIYSDKPTKVDAIQEARSHIFTDEPNVLRPIESTQRGFGITSSNDKSSNNALSTKPKGKAVKRKTGIKRL